MEVREMGERGIDQRRLHTEYPPGVCPVYDHCNDDAERAINDAVQPHSSDRPSFSRNTFRLLRGFGFTVGVLAVISLGPFYFMRRAVRWAGRILLNRHRKQ